MTTAVPSDHGTSPPLPPRVPKVAEALAREIVHEIVSRTLPSGTRLASEAQMLEDYGVGRGSLREALRILEVHGVITMKPGRNGGPTVAEVRTRDHARMSTLLLHVSGVTLRELMEARLVMEPLMARLAAARRGQELAGAVADPETTRVDDEDTYVRVTSDFHRRVAAMSGNRVLDQLTAVLEDIFRDQVSGILAPAEERRDVLSAHAAVAVAIADGKADEAEQLMRDHLRQYADRAQTMVPNRLDAVVDWR